MANRKQKLPYDRWKKVTQSIFPLSITNTWPEALMQQYYADNYSPLRAVEAHARLKIEGKMRQTRTFATIGIPEDVFNDLCNRLQQAGYDILDGQGQLDMHGLALVKGEPLKAWHPFNDEEPETFPTHSGEYLAKCYDPGERMDGHVISPEGRWKDVVYIDVFIEEGERKVTCHGTTSESVCIQEICRIPGNEYTEPRDYDKEPCVSIGDLK